MSVCQTMHTHSSCVCVCVYRVCSSCAYIQWSLILNSFWFEAEKKHKINHKSLWILDLLHQVCFRNQTVAVLKWDKSYKILFIWGKKTQVAKCSIKYQHRKIKQWKHNTCKSRAAAAAAAVPPRSHGTNERPALKKKRSILNSRFPVRHCPTKG